MGTCVRGKCQNALPFNKSTFHARANLKYKKAAATTTALKRQKLLSDLKFLLHPQI